MHNLSLTCCRIGAVVVLSVLAVKTAVAKPIAFADGTTIMAEYGAGTMEELDLQRIGAAGRGPVDVDGVDGPIGRRGLEADVGTRRADGGIARIRAAFVRCADGQGLPEQA